MNDFKLSIIIFLKFIISLLAIAFVLSTALGLAMVYTYVVVGYIEELGNGELYEYTAMAAGIIGWALIAFGIFITSKGVLLVMWKSESKAVKARVGKRRTAKHR